MTKEEALRQIKELEKFIENCDKRAGFEDDEIFLLSIEEYEKYRDNIPLLNCWWWLRSPGNNGSIYAACVSYGGSVNFSGGLVSYDGGCVRPALHLESNNLPIGRRIIKHEFPWIIIDTDLAIAEVPIATHKFDGDSNDYTISEVRRFLKEWKENRLNN